MKETKVYSVLNSFSIYERNRLRKIFCCLPTSIKMKRSANYFEILDLAIKEEDDRSLTQSVIWQRLYPGTALVEQKLRKNLSDLLKLIQEFLALEQYQAKPFA